MKALCDTGFLLAAIAENDNFHDICALALEEEEQPLLPYIVLPELAYLVMRDMDVAVLAGFLRSVATGDLPAIDSTLTDLLRAADLLQQYADARVDFVDCMIVAMAERLNITRIMTVDRRHFSLFRPKHCRVFELIP